MGASSVRRNIFQNHLSRRPVAGPGNGSSSGLSSQPIQHNAPEPSIPSLSSGPVDDGEIVVKDKNGGYRLDIPILPPIVGEDGDEMEGIENGGAGNPATGTGAESTRQGEREKEKIDASLVELMYRNRNRRMSSEPHEILTLVYQSLRTKVASLEEDNWMYEPEPDNRL